MSGEAGPVAGQAVQARTRLLRSQGVMHARDPASGQVRRMSKSAGNVVTPDQVAETRAASLPDAPTPQPLSDELVSEIRAALAN